MLPVLLVSLAPCLSGCAAEPEPLPTEVRVAAADARMARAEQPPLYQLLYDYAFLPRVQAAEQRVRILIWLRAMDLSEWQLQALGDLHQRAERERERIESASRQVVRDYEPRIRPSYDELWDALRSGKAIDAPELEAVAGSLVDERIQHAREQELLELRLQGVRSVLDASREWLASLSPRQEALLTDATFFMRDRLDPYANPGDFRALVGSIFVAGEWGTLTRGSFDPSTDQLDLGGLWSDRSWEELKGPVFNDARRELLLYMALLEPTLPEAVDAALEARRASGREP